MLDRIPDGDDSVAAWFRYFRMTKHLPGMAMKFDAEMKRADTARRARMVLTAYTAAAMDVVIFCGFQPREKLAQELQETFGLKPAHLMMLSVDEVAQPLKITPRELTERLREGGFEISAAGLVTGFAPPNVPSPAPRPRPPGF